MPLRSAEGASPSNDPGAIHKIQLQLGKTKARNHSETAPQNLVLLGTFRSERDKLTVSATQHFTSLLLIDKYSLPPPFATLRLIDKILPSGPLTAVAVLLPSPLL